MNVLAIIKKSITDLKGYWNIAILASLLMGLLPMTIQYNKTLGLLLVLLFSGALKAGVSKISLLIVNKQKLEFLNIFDGFYMFKNALGVFLLSMVFIALGLICFIVPGIIIMIWLSQSFFILIENPSLEPLEVFKKSKALIKGHEFQFFVLIIIFSLLTVLLILSKLFILSLFISSIQYVVLANFYLNLKGNNND